MKRTLLVIGAGASKSIYRHFPTGAELIQEINKNFSCDIDLEHFKSPETIGLFVSTMMNTIIQAFGNFENIRNKSLLSREGVVGTHEFKLLLEMKNLLWKTLVHYESKYYSGDEIETLSIDNFVTREIDKLKKEYLDYDIFKEDGLVDNLCKAAIYYLIKGAENAFIEHHYGKEGEKESSSKRDFNWIQEFVRRIGKDDLERLNEEFWVLDFNYDRIFEYVFPIEIRKRFNLNSEEYVQKDFLPSNAIHPYGSLGLTTALEIDSDNNNSGFMREFYSKIELMRQGHEPKNKFDYLDVDQVAFFGFGYDDINMKVVNSCASRGARKFGTGYGMSSSAKDNVTKEHSVTFVRDLNEFLDSVFTPF